MTQHQPGLPMTLLETAVLLATMSILTLAVVQGAAATADRAAINQVQGQVLQAYREAQATARALGGRAELLLAADSIVVRGFGPDSLIGRRRPGPRASNVGLSPASYAIVYGPDGLAMGAGNVTIVLNRGTTSRQIVVSRLGRVRLN